MPLPFGKGGVVVLERVGFLLWRWTVQFHGWRFRWGTAWTKAGALRAARHAVRLDLDREDG